MNNVLKSVLQVVIFVIAVIIYGFGFGISKKILEGVTGFEYAVCNKSHCMQICGMELLLVCIMIVILFAADVFPKSLRSFRPIKWRMTSILFIMVLMMEMANSLFTHWIFPETKMDIGIVYMASNIFGYTMIVVIAPIVEELFFRGTILAYMLKKRWNPYLAIVLSAFLFGVLHMNLTQGFNAAIMGALSGYLFYRTHSIWPSALLHILMNRAALSHIEDKVANTDLLITMPEQIILFAVFVLVSSFLWWVANGYNKRERKALTPLRRKTMTTNIETK